jgi:hypothetical protein
MRVPSPIGKLQDVAPQVISRTGIINNNNRGTISGSSDNIAPFLPNGTITKTSLGSVWFDGVDDSYSYADSASFDFPDGDWFLAALIQVEVSALTQYIASIGTQGGPNNVQLYMVSGVINVQVRGPASNTGVYLGTATLTAPGWYVVGLQRNAGTIEVFTAPLSGTITKTTTTSTAWSPFSGITPSGTHQCGIRSSSPTGTQFKSNIAYLVKGAGTLSDADVNNLASLTLPTALGKSLSFYTEFDEALPTIPDLTGNGNTATRVSNPMTRGGPDLAGQAVRINGVSNRAWGRVYQRASGGNSRAITFTGTYAGSPTSLQARIIGLNDVEVVTWANCIATGVGTWSITITVPQGLSYYILEVRHTNDITQFAKTFYPFGVGEVILGIGQSNFKLLATGAGDSGITADVHKVCYYNGGSGGPAYRDDRITSLGAGIKSLAVLAQANIGANIPVMIADASTSGSALLGTPNTWSDLGGTVWATLNSTLAAVGDVGAIVWNQGEADASANATKTNYFNGLVTLVSNVRLAIGRNAASCPFFCWSLGHAGTLQGGNWGGIREAHLDAIASIPNSRYTGPAHDLDLADALHYLTSERGYYDLGRRIAHAISNYYNPVGIPTNMDGPFITGATRSGSTITITFNLNSNASISIPSASPANIDGLEVRRSGTLQTISSWVISGNQLTLTMAAAVNAGDTVDYAARDLIRTNTGAAYALTDNDNMIYGSNIVTGSPRGVPVRPMPTAIVLV